MNPDKTILIVDDDTFFTSSLESYLANEGFNVLIAHKGQQALNIAREQKPDLIVLDIVLPDLSGWQVCKRFRQESTVPIIILTSQNEEGDRILGLRLGADDYLPKPCNFHELLARIHAIFRRMAFARFGWDTHIQIGDVRLNFAACRVYKREQMLALRQKEYNLLYTLMGYAGRVVSRAKLLNEVWGVDWLGDTRTLDVHIRWVRQKIEEDPGRPRYIQTVRGVGYRFAAPDELN